MLISIIAGAAALTAESKADLVLAIGRLLQAARNRTFVEQLRSEWERLLERGAIKSDYGASTQARECMQEILEFLDSPTADEPRFEAIKNLFLATATERRSVRDDPRPQQYLRILRSLTAGECLVLLACYRRGAVVPDNQVGRAEIWLAEIAVASRLVHPELVELHERRLIDLRLLQPRHYPDQSGVINGARGRLTSLGIAVCELAVNPPIETSA